MPVKITHPRKLPLLSPPANASAVNVCECMASSLLAALCSLEFGFDCLQRLLEFRDARFHVALRPLVGAVTGLLELGQLLIDGQLLRQKLGDQFELDVRSCRLGFGFERFKLR